jgi:hypothetical protein
MQRVHRPQHETPFVSVPEVQPPRGEELMTASSYADPGGSLLWWIDVLSILPVPARNLLAGQLTRLRDEWLAANWALRGRFPAEPTTNIDGLTIPPWVDINAVFDKLRTHYTTQHNALAPRDVAAGYIRRPDCILGAAPTRPVAANYFVVHDTATTTEPVPNHRHHAIVHLWLGTIGLARDADWHAPGDATKIEGRSTTCFVHVELVRAEKGAIVNAAADTYPNPRISTARAAGTRYTDQQYDDLANPYIVASLRRGRFLTVTVHSEVDRSAASRPPFKKSHGHNDPDDFDVGRFYRLVDAKLGLPESATYGITQQRVDEPNQAGQVNVFIEYARGHVAAANQYGPILQQAGNPTMPQGDSAGTHYKTSLLYLMPLRDAGKSVLLPGNGKWELGPA